MWYSNNRKRKGAKQQMKLLKKETFDTSKEFTIVINDDEAIEMVCAIIDAIEHNEETGYKRIATDQEILFKEFIKIIR